MKTDLQLVIKDNKPVNKLPALPLLTQEVEKVLTLYRAKVSYTEIGKLIGKSRAAVAGMVGRARDKGHLKDRPPSNAHKKGHRKQPRIQLVVPEIVERVIPTIKPQLSPQIVAVSSQAVVRMSEMLNMRKMPKFKAVATAPQPRRVRLKLVDSPTAVTFAELKTHHCRYPQGDPRHSDFRFCGRLRIEKSPYCLEHSKLTRNAVPARRR